MTDQTHQQRPFEDFLAKANLATTVNDVREDLFLASQSCANARIESLLEPQFDFAKAVEDYAKHCEKAAALLRKAVTTYQITELLNGEFGAMMAANLGVDLPITDDPISDDS